MVTGYTPKWKHDSGNVLIFAASNTLFDTKEEALEWVFAQFLFMLAFGLSKDGILELEHDDGKFQIPHVEVKVGKLGLGMVIEGPMLEKALAEEVV